MFWAKISNATCAKPNCPEQPDVEIVCQTNVPKPNMSLLTKPFIKDVQQMFLTRTSSTQAQTIWGVLLACSAAGEVVTAHNVYTGPSYWRISWGFQDPRLKHM